MHTIFLSLSRMKDDPQKESIDAMPMKLMCSDEALLKELIAE